ncbi:MAG: HAMP domain-containing histidine kinase [Alphaproteobacteria bacterium]|nr:HAMP domain-containing histidine kinase [Alphaproteobacteria bacterium]
MFSLRARLFVVWLLSLAAACAVGWLLFQLYRQSTSAQLARAEAAVARGCERIADRYAFYVTGWAGPVQASADPALRRDLTTVVSLGLADSRGVEGGVWQLSAGPLAYAFPTYEGTGPKTDLPEAERARIAALNAAAAQAERSQRAEYAAGAQTLVLNACPLPGPIADLTAWTMTRVIAAAGLDALRLGLGVLLALVLALAAWLTWLVLAWTRHVGRIEAALAMEPAGALPRLRPTGEAELDRIVAALNTAGARLAEARQRSAELAARVSQSERLAALGRVAAGVAHEFRNPLGAMRLKAENALAGDPARRAAALEAILAQIARLDHLIAELLAMTQQRTPEPEPIVLADFLAAVAADHSSDGVALRVAAPKLTCRLDPALLRRALDALLDNALRHTPRGGSVTVRAEALPAGGVRIEVADTGPGIPPALRGALFEPFVTGRADGTGLGLAIARELVEAQNGRLVLTSAGGEPPGRGAVLARGAVFTIEFPSCRES